MRSFPRKSISATLESRSAFTVIELLVAAAVTAVLAGILLTMTNGVLRVWNQSSGSLSTNNEAQLIFDMLKEDLQSAVYRNNGGVWMAAEILDTQSLISGRDWTVNSGSGNFKPDSAISVNLDNTGTDELPLSETRYGLGGVWLRFFTTAGGTEPRAVAYQMARRKVTGDPTDPLNQAETRYMLYRSQIGPESTLQRGFNLNKASPPSEPQANYNDPNALYNPPPGEVIGNNVIDFGMRLYWNHGGTVYPVFPVDLSGQWSGNAAAKEYFAYGDFNNPFPDVVDVMVRILTQEGARLIQNLEEGRLPPEGTFDEAWWAIAEEHSRVFTQRIYVNTRPL